VIALLCLAPECHWLARHFTATPIVFSIQFALTKEKDEIKEILRRQVPG
jgi:hypothetical protein